MKKYVSLVLLSCLMSISSASAQKKPQIDYLNAHIQASGTHFGNPVTDKKWGNQNGKSFTTAKFSDYSGESFVLLTVSQSVKVTFETLVELNSGTLDFVLLDANGTQIYGQNCSQTTQDKTEIPLKAGTYRWVFTGNHARGSYTSQWREL